MNRQYLHSPVKSMTKVGVLHENAQISGRIWRKLISLMSIWANYTCMHLKEGCLITLKERTRSCECFFRRSVVERLT